MPDAGQRVCPSAPAGTRGELDSVTFQTGCNSFQCISVHAIGVEDAARELVTET